MANQQERIDEKPSLSQDAASTTVDSDKETYPTGVKLVVILFSVGLVVLLMALDVSVIATAIPSITTRFHSTTDIGWYAATYPLALCSLQPLAGKIFTLFSIKWTFLLFVCIFLFGSLLCGVAVSSNMFIIGRAVAGAGASGLFSGAMAILLVVSPLKKRAIYMGLLTSLFGVATILGPVLGGALTHKASWRWCFYINLPCGALTIPFLILFFHPPERDSEKKYTAIEKIKQLDIIGSALFIPSIIMILLALQWGGHQHAWNSATIIGLFVGFTGLLNVFLFWEYRRGDNAMVPFSILLNRSIILCCLFVFLLMGSYLLCVYYLAEWFQAVKGANPLHSGLMQLPSVISQILSSAAGGLLAHRTGYYNPFLFSGAICLSIATGLYTTFTTNTPHARWISYQVLQGLGAGVGVLMPILTVQAVLSSRPRQIPLAISLVAFFQYFGGSVFQSIGLAVFQNQLIKALTYDVKLDQNQVAMLLNAGSGGVREAVDRMFPEKMAEVLGAYNKAITTVFFVPVAGTIGAFILATGVEWKNVKSKAKPSQDLEGGAIVKPGNQETADVVSKEEKP